MRIEELDYELPRELIAQRPAARRDGSRLLVLGPGGRIEHRSFSEIASLLAPGSVLVVNDSRVFPARITGLKPTGGRFEVLLVRRLGPAGTRERWAALATGLPGPGTRLVRGRLALTPEGALGGGLVAVTLEAGGSGVGPAIEVEGSVPLPPYIRREAGPEDAERYQTVYAREPGSAAAPTAGLHFTLALLDEIRSRGHEIVAVTLHVGPGTFQPVRSATLEEHVMHEEWARVGEREAWAILAARAGGRRVVACGTTVARTLESVARLEGGLRAWEGPVELFIRPGHRFEVVDDLVTNFHLPRSTLLALVMALAGRERVLMAYAQAVERRYRFYSYGDAMLVRGPGGPQ
jgi:S-adenosylmethionine:tRNA ribosyltransferase-isomerase